MKDTVCAMNFEGILMVREASMTEFLSQGMPRDSDCLASVAVYDGNNTYLSAIDISCIQRPGPRNHLKPMHEFEQVSAWGGICRVKLSRRRMRRADGNAAHWGRGCRAHSMARRPSESRMYALPNSPTRMRKASMLKGRLSSVRRLISACVRAARNRDHTYNKIPLRENAQRHRS